MHNATSITTSYINVNNSSDAT